MILRRIASAIRRQDWFVVFIEIVIVVLGVYIGIYLGDIQQAQKFKQDTDTALAALETELRSDLERLNEVIAIQTRLVAGQDELMALLSADELAGRRAGDLMRVITNENDTFFPNRGAYTTLQTEGYLAALGDEALGLQISRLFEREFVRQGYNAELYDELGFKLAGEAVGNYWDHETDTLIPGKEHGAIIIRNWLLVFHNQGKFYLGFLTETVQPELVKTLEMIDAYQGENVQ